jgi:hypothetical protein
LAQTVANREGFQHFNDVQAHFSIQHTNLLCADRYDGAQPAESEQNPFGIASDILAQ